MATTAVIDRTPQSLTPARQNSRKFGRHDFNRFNSLSPWYVCAGEKDIRTVHVDCRLLCKESKLGFFGTGRDEQPAGVIFLAFDISQPDDCRLSSVAVEVTLDQEHHLCKQYRTSSTRNISSPLQVRTWGPTKLTGEKRKETVEVNTSGTPSAQFPGGGFGGLGFSKTRTVECCSRWTFHGSLVRAARSRLYSGLKWTLTENTLDKGSRSSGNFYTAFSFQYNGQPLVMKVKIDGKLGRSDKWKEKSKKVTRAWKKKFGPREDHPEDISTTLIEHVPAKNLRLDNLADALGKMMEKKNLLEGVPVEVPDVQPSAYLPTTAGPEDDGELAQEGVSMDDAHLHSINSTSQMPYPRAWRAGVCRVPTWLVDEEPRHQPTWANPTEPTLSNLFHAQDKYFAPCMSRSIVREVSEVSPAATLVEEEEEDENDESRNDQSGIDNSHVDQEMVAKVLRIAAVRMLLQLLANLLDLVGSQASPKKAVSRKMLQQSQVKGV
ncbi:hypothetical protein B0T10DRAFT_576964 [Thelonectria olida]|uniref:Uncharacterized protein n=1 Tax=Thelonectria olida TaxID=1576542 RepID=A0A9P8W2C3_9HYPO|nr:hypothetical protein B0T10DRAFT_576964 [Thelonectria olida]